MLKLQWADFKAYAITAAALPLRGFEDPTSYYVYAVDGGFTVWTQLDKSPSDTTERDDYVNNYKPSVNTRIGQLDSNGAPFLRQKSTKPGWHYCPNFLEFTTAKYDTVANANALHHKQSDNSTDIGESSLKFYNSGGTELKRSDYISDALFITALATTCVKSVLDWQSTYDFDPRAAAFIMGTKPAAPAYLYVTVAPDIPVNLGGSVPFNTGGVPLHLLNDNSVTGWEAMTVKSVVADPVYKSNKFRLLMYHAAGAQINGCLAIQLYRA